MFEKILDSPNINPDYALEVFFDEQGAFSSPTSALNGPRQLFNQLFNAEITESDAEAAEIKSAPLNCDYSEIVS
jgi:hypothetical protein